MKSRLIVNPVSGTDAAPDYLRRINERLRAGFGEMDIVMTTGPCDAADAAEEAARGGDYDRLFVAGGDGTLNEVVNGAARVAGALARLTFGLVPLGTGNDFAAALGLPEDVDAALEVLLAGRTVAVDVGSMNGRRFVNVSAGGFIAEVSDAVDPRLKTVAGKLAYLVGGAQVLLDFEPFRARLRAVTQHDSERRAANDELDDANDEIDGADDGEAGDLSDGAEGGAVIERELNLQMFAVCNSRLVGGGRLIAPRAVIDDGSLDVCLVEAMPTLEFVGLLTRVAGGEHVSDERVRYFRARSLELAFDREVKVNTDGEVLEADSCAYAVEPRAARFLAGDAPYASRRAVTEE